MPGTPQISLVPLPEVIFFLPSPTSSPSLLPQTTADLLSIDVELSFLEFYINSII